MAVMTRDWAFRSAISLDLDIEFIGDLPMPEFGEKIENRQSSCEFVTEGRREVEVGEGVVEWVPAETCGMATNGLEIHIARRVHCWAHTPDPVKAAVARRYGNNPVHGLDAGLFNRARLEGVFGEALRLVAPGAKGGGPALLEGSVLEVYGKR